MTVSGKLLIAGLLLLLIITADPLYSTINPPWYYRYGERGYITILIAGAGRFNKTAFVHHLSSYLGKSADQYLYRTDGFTGVVYRSPRYINYIVFAGTLVINNTNYTILRVAGITDLYRYSYSYQLNGTIDNATINELVMNTAWGLVGYSEGRGEMICATITPSPGQNSSTGTCYRQTIRKYMLVYNESGKIPLTAEITVFTGLDQSTGSFTSIEIEAEYTGKYDDIALQLLHHLGAGVDRIRWRRKTEYIELNALHIVLWVESVYLQRIGALNLSGTLNISELDFRVPVNSTLLITGHEHRFLNQPPPHPTIYDLQREPAGLPIDPLHPYVTFTAHPPTTSLNTNYTTQPPGPPSTDTTWIPPQTPLYPAVTDERIFSLAVSFIIALVAAYIIYRLVKEWF